MAGGDEPDGDQPRVETGRDPYVTWTAEVDTERVDCPMLAAPVVAEASWVASSNSPLSGGVDVAYRGQAFF